MKVNFLIVGAQKAGTTSLYYYLKDHPEICMSIKKEVHYFSLEENFSKGYFWYEKHFKHCAGKKAIGEASPLYMYLEEVPQRIYEYNPNMKLIFMLRNPVDRAWSQYWLMKRMGREDLGFEQAIQQEENRIQRDFTYLRRFSYKDRGKYIEQIHRFLKYFPRKHIFFIISEQLRKEPEIILKDLYRFLGVDDNYELNGRKFRAMKGKRSKIPALSKLLYNSFLGNFILLRKANDKLNAKPIGETMKPATRKFLIDFFRESNDKLAQEFGLDIQQWNS